MSFKFDPNAASDKKYVQKEGTYTVTVKGTKGDYMPPRADYYTKITLETDDEEIVFADIFLKPEKSGEYTRLNQFIAATASKEEIEKYLARGEFTPDQEFLDIIANRSVGRRLKVVVTKRTYTKKDGSEGVSYNGSYFRRLPEGPDQPF